MTIIKKGQTVYGQNTKLKYLKNNQQKDAKFAVVVSKKVSKSAVVRNRIRRRIYSAIRLKYLSKKGIFTLFIYSDSFAWIKFSEIQNALDQLFKDID